MERMNIVFITVSLMQKKRLKKIGVKLYPKEKSGCGKYK
jgi:hypothetical protein